MVSTFLPRFHSFFMWLYIMESGCFLTCRGIATWESATTSTPIGTSSPEIIGTLKEAKNPSAASLPKIGKRDLWELVSASSDVISMESDINSNSSTSPRIYNPIYNAPLPSNTIPPHFNLQMRLHKLDYYFRVLKIFEEDCRQRFLCELSRDQEKYMPLSGVFLDETSYSGNEKLLSARLLTSNEGTRLLTYIEASHRGLNREGCDVWMYRCPQSMDSQIDFNSLVTWREVIKWLTVKMVARKKY